MLQSCDKIGTPPDGEADFMICTLAGKAGQRTEMGLLLMNL